MKPLFVISCPIDTYSGYGARSRDLVKAIIETNQYDVRILSQRWGNTPWGFLDENPKWAFLKKHVLQTNQLPVLLPVLKLPLHTTLGWSVSIE